MSLLNLCDNTLLCILNYIHTNKESVKLRLVCRRLKYVCDRYGYIKQLVLDTHTNYPQFIYLYNQHYNSIRSLNVIGIDDPAIWIPTSWPHRVEFSRCYIAPSPIQPPLSPTEILVIDDATYNTNITGSRGTLRINWRKLPYLRKLYIKAVDIDFSGMEHCHNLEKVYLDIKNRHRLLPVFFSQLPRLEVLISTTYSPDPLHFVSPRLNLLVLNKQYPSTTTSQKIPKKHLDTALVSPTSFLYAHLDL